MFPHIKLEVLSKRRRNSFNLTYGDKTVWDGHSMGPPRALKFDILLGTKLHDLIMAEAE